MDSQQQFCLKWNSFGSNLATVFGNLFKSDNLADVTLFCEGSISFRAHKLILAACSKHLADLFETAPPSPNLFIILDSTSAANMSALLEFMYKGEVHVSQDSLSSFLKAAEYLQVKGLSIEHEKLAVAHSQHHAQEPPLDSPTARKHGRLSSSGSKDECDTPHSMYHPAPSPSSYSPAMSPYMQPHHYRNHEQRLNAQTPNYDSPRKRPLRSPTEILQDAAAVRASVLRDGSKAVTGSRPNSPSCAGSSGPLSLAFRPSSSSSSSLPPQPEADAPPEHKYESSDAAATASFDRTAVVKLEQPDSRRHSGENTNFPEDLRMKMDTGTPTQAEEMQVNTSTGNNPSGNYISNGTPQSTTTDSTTTNLKEDKYNRNVHQPEILPANLWNSVTGKLYHKAGSVTTPDGKKMKCPFCERLYGYETNLRAHIRQRHQGIRVPCPFCSRTFTRNNTVRRHIAREHKTELLKQQQQAAGGQPQPQQIHNHTQ